MVRGGASESEISFKYANELVDAESIDFWVRLFTPELAGEVTIIVQADHFEFSIDTGAKEVKFGIPSGAGPDFISAPSSNYLDHWMHIGLGISLTGAQSNLIVNDNAAVYEKLPNARTSISGNVVIMPVSNSDSFIVGIKDFRLWSAFKNPGELRGLQYSRPSFRAHDLELYLPLDESSGYRVLEGISNTYIELQSDEYWVRYDDITVADKLVPENAHRDTAIAMQKQSNVEFPLTTDLGIYSEFTMMLWGKFSKKAQFDLMLHAETCLYLSIKNPGNDQSVECFAGYNATAAAIGPEFLQANTWTAFTLTKSLATYNIPDYDRLYIGGHAVKITWTAGTSVCNASAPLSNHHGRFSNLLPAELSLVKDLKVFGIVLSQAEVLRETFTRSSAWDYFPYLRHYWPLDEFGSGKFGDYAINHLHYIRNEVLPSGDTGKNVIEFSEEPIWIDDAPKAVCESQEGYDSAHKRCVPLNKGLMFIRGFTHPVKIQTSSVEKNFTVEFWIKLTRDERDFQDIIRTSQFVIRYDKSKFSLTMFNRTILEAKGYKVTSAAGSHIEQWTHVAATSLELLYKITILVNGEPTVLPFYVAATEQISTWAVSNETSGFTGMLRELRLWRAYRAPTRIKLEMHLQQQDSNGMNFNLVGYFPLAEGSGFALHDHSSTSPNSVGNFRDVGSSLQPPFWVRVDTVPFLCSASKIYDVERRKCRMVKRVLGIEDSVTLQLGEAHCYREWTFHAWVKYTENTVIEVPNLFRLEKTKADRNLGTAETPDYQSVDAVQVKFNIADSTISTASTVTIFLPSTYVDTNGDTWYYFTVGYTYARSATTFDHGEAIFLPVVSTNQPWNTLETSIVCPVTSCGKQEVVLKSGKFMHVSLWKKYLQRTQFNLEEAVVTDQFANPYSLP